MELPLLSRQAKRRTLRRIRPSKMARTSPRKKVFFLVSLGVERETIVKIRRRTKSQIPPGMAQDRTRGGSNVSLQPERPHRYAALRLFCRARATAGTATQ